MCRSIIPRPVRRRWYDERKTGRDPDSPGVSFGKEAHSEEDGGIGDSEYERVYPENGAGRLLHQSGSHRCQRTGAFAAHVQ